MKPYSENKEERFERLLHAVDPCSLCRRMGCRRKVLSPANGCLTAKVLFVAEAPGRLGADATGVPLHGDAAGRNFERLLGSAGWRRDEVFITNAVLCNPRDDRGNNNTPTRDEVANCAPYLGMTIDLVDPEVVVTLGATALHALSMLRPHRYELRRDAAKPHRWNGRVLFPLYHPASRALVHRPMEGQLRDFQQLQMLVDSAVGPESHDRGRPRIQRGRAPKKRGQLEQVLLVIVASLGGRTSLFKLTKLLYLVDLEAYSRWGRTLTGSTFLRMQDGPWIPKLFDVAKDLNGGDLSLSYIGAKTTIETGPAPSFHLSLSDSEIDLVVEIVERHGDKSDSSIKTAAYLTEPMRNVLRQEKAGLNLLRRPVLGPKGPYAI